MGVQHETYRRETFRSYHAPEIPNFNQYINEFAYYGFFAVKRDNRDIVLCFSCNLQCLKLRANETDPLDIHRKYNPLCPFVNGRPTSNIPAPEHKDRTFNPINPSGIGYAARFPEYAFKTNRENSFKNWPSSSRMRVTDLVDAGLFYLGQSDKVSCFACGIGLMDFDDHDIPMEEHRKFAVNNCEFLKRHFRHNL